MPTASTDLPAAPGARDIAEAGEAAVEAPAAEAVGGAEETEDADGISSMNGQELADRLGLSEWAVPEPSAPYPALSSCAAIVAYALSDNPLRAADIFATI
eukprot:gene26831-10679_t